MKEKTVYKADLTITNSDPAQPITETFTVQVEPKNPLSGVEVTKATVTLPSAKPMQQDHIQVVVTETGGDVTKNQVWASMEGSYIADHIGIAVIFTQGKVTDVSLRTDGIEWTLDRLEREVIVEEPEGEDSPIEETAPEKQPNVVAPRTLETDKSEGAVATVVLDTSVECDVVFSRSGVEHMKVNGGMLWLRFKSGEPYSMARATLVKSKAGPVNMSVSAFSVDASALEDVSAEDAWGLMIKGDAKVFLFVIGRGVYSERRFVAEKTGKASHYDLFEIL